MKKVLCILFAVVMLQCLATSVKAQISIGIGLPNVRIGINLPLYPELAPVPGYPVYYAPSLNANYFFYDGMYWVYQDDNWYASSWYNGPWGIVGPEVVPLYILRIPVRYYRQPPAYFSGWKSSEPPRWGKHWGHEWEQRRMGWDQWKRESRPKRAPLPHYQRNYSGDRYPRVEEQRPLHNQHYRYQSRDSAVRQHLKQQRDSGASGVDPQRVRGDEVRSPRGQEPPYVRRGEVPESRSHDAPARREQQAPIVHDQEGRSHDRGESQEPKRGHGQNRDEGRGRDRDN